MNKGAIFSDGRVYRYTLVREWDAAKPLFVFIGLNPSTADETQDDPTIRRVIRFAKRAGCGRLLMLNIFGFRSTDPQGMLDAFDPVGPLNNKFIGMSDVSEAKIVVRRCRVRFMSCSWKAQRSSSDGRAHWVLGVRSLESWFRSPRRRARATSLRQAG